MNSRGDHRNEAMEKLSSDNVPFTLDLIFRRRLGRLLLAFLLAAAALPLTLLGLFSYLVTHRELLNAVGATHLPGTVIAAAVLLTALGVLLAAALLSHRIVGPIEELARDVAMAARGQMADAIEVDADNEIGELARAVADLLDHLKTAAARHQDQIQFMSALTRLHGLIGGEQELEKLNLNTLEFLYKILDLRRADIYIVHDDAELRWQARFPGLPGQEEDLAGRAGKQRAADALRQKTSLWLQKQAADKPAEPASAIDKANLITLPLQLRQTGLGALDLEKTGRFTASDGRFAEAAARVIAVALNAAILRRQEKSLLERSREQAAELSHREPALQAKTRELESQTRALQASEETLQLKQLELEAANAQMTKNAVDLEANMAVLEQQKQDMQQQNRALHKAHRELAEKARQLELSSQYKSEFLANMSHELRTPLNSILLLSRLLLENKDKNLLPKQSEFARTIHSAGEDLLNLINEILDLAKVESGKMEVQIAPVSIRDITRSMLVTFSPLAEQNRVAFEIHVAPDVPEALVTDRKRLEQIIKNFLSNAFKFTSEGSIRLEIAVSREENRSGNGGKDILTIGVADTGIGIPAAKQEMVFDAFQQVDGSNRRKYGGTGLGLSISRELARILGGEIRLESEDGVGSRFTLHLPLTPPEEKPLIADGDVSDMAPAVSPEARSADSTKPPAESEGPDRDDRNRLAPGDKCILIVDTDADTIAPIKSTALQKGYKTLVAEQFSTGLHFADYYRPAAILLNLELPSENGWKMVSRLKTNPKSRHIPIFVLSPRGDAFEAATRGAAGYLAAPPDDPEDLETVFRRIEELHSMEQRRVLVAAPDRKRAKRIADTVDGFGLKAVAVTTEEDARAVLQSDSPQAVIVHPAMVTGGRHEFLAVLQKDPMPVFQYSGNPLKADARPEAGPYAHRLNIQGVDMPDQLLTALVSRLHLPPEALDEACRVRLAAMDSHIDSLKGRRVLLVDDDMRTVFAVSNVLEDLGVEVVTGKTGKESLDKLSGFPEIDLILMDVMISGVDGYRSMRQIREEERYTDLPIIALTAKAMRGDRAKCIRAGADDYLSKPVNPDKLTSMLKIWFQLKQSTI
ncbi:response regulator [uncultured Desulfosarcina sp.]|uniref:response regulator n=1 Tax=uncultured Desulfosarcina sp. TaxID=218289 RepID=UPI0029C70E09|nr:response regulator [uncultured Desulfosarcina sp.]